MLSSGLAAGVVPAAIVLASTSDGRARRTFGVLMSEHDLAGVLARGLYGRLLASFATPGTRMSWEVHVGGWNTMSGVLEGGVLGVGHVAGPFLLQFLSSPSWQVTI